MAYPEYASGGGQGYILKILGQHFGLQLQRVKEELNEERTYTAIVDFLKGDERVPKLVFFYQTRDAYAEDGEFVEVSGERAHRRPEAARGGGTRARLHGYALAHLPPLFHAPAHAANAPVRRQRPSVSLPHYWRARAAKGGGRLLHPPRKGGEGGLGPEA